MSVGTQQAIPLFKTESTIQKGGFIVDGMTLGDLRIALAENCGLGSENEDRIVNLDRVQSTVELCHNATAAIPA